MTHDELITVARTHTVDFPTALDAVAVSFENDQHPKKIMILLERESGKFIASWLMPKNPK